MAQILLSIILVTLMASCIDEDITLHEVSMPADKSEELQTVLRQIEMLDQDQIRTLILELLEDKMEFESE